MNAQTQSQAVRPVLAILATSKFNHQQSKWQLVKRTKKPKKFDAFLQAAYGADDETLLLYSSGCYGKDAKPVVGNVSSFNELS
ncbi:MAG: hypothetical protein IJ801_08420 [Lachnospiraceae bacterium]|nr:hypothetical protein [Lachnospiraceae bacterium]